MATDDERREVSARLRTCTPPASYTSAQGGGWSHLCDMALAVGLTREEDPSAWTLANRLADLIEPSEPKVKCVAEVKVDGEKLEKLVHEAVVEYAGVDRDALLKLAEELEKCAWYFGLDFDEDEPLRDRLKEASEDFAGCARRIREALGVSDD